MRHPTDSSRRFRFATPLEAPGPEKRRPSDTRGGQWRCDQIGLDPAHIRGHNATLEAKRSHRLLTAARADSVGTVFSPHLLKPPGMQDS